ncbi:hypothetical protein G9A89_002243 [Geosiphon pyriformis]|nr:hypothetical protein G9A89_002243 [Geosiphon pyriformis]
MILPAFNDIIVIKERDFDSTVPRSRNIEDPRGLIKSSVAIKENINKIFPHKSREENYRGITSSKISDHKDLFQMKTQSREIVVENTSLNTVGKAIKLPPKSSKRQSIAIIGIHGWMPNLLQKLYPTPPSELFCEKMKDSICEYLKIKSEEANITKISLSGHGKVEDRVEKYYENIKTNIAQRKSLEEAKFIFIVSHSQGVPTSILLLSMLLDSEILNSKNQQICALLMAGINQGPVSGFRFAAEIEGIVLNDLPTIELFQFQFSQSKLAQRYRDATRNVLIQGVKIVYMASGNDEVVPLHSSLFVNFNHPAITRCIYINEDAYRCRQFIADLIRYLILLRNSGLSDQNLLLYISDSIVGYLKDGGHRRIYTEPETYKYSIQHLFESKRIDQVEPIFEDFDHRNYPNEFYFPWAIRGLLSDPHILTSNTLTKEIILLQEKFSEWDPTKECTSGKESVLKLKLQMAPFGDPKEAKFLPAIFNSTKTDLTSKHSTSVMN